MVFALTLLFDVVKRPDDVHILKAKLEHLGQKGVFVETLGPNRATGRFTLEGTEGTFHAIRRDNAGLEVFVHASTPNSPLDAIQCRLQEILRGK